VVFSLVSGFFPVQECTLKDWRYKRLARDQQAGIGACESIYKTYKRTCPFSADLKELIDSMLIIDPAKRLSIDGVCDSVWLAKAPQRAGNAVGGDGIVYRGSGAMYADDDEMMDDFMIPEHAVPLSRQKAERLVNEGEVMQMEP